MAKGTKLSEFEKGEITAQREISKVAVKLLSAITWKVQISMEQEDFLVPYWQTRKIITTIQEKNCSWS